MSVRTRTVTWIATALAITASSASCSSNPANEGGTKEPAYSPDIPTNWASGVTNTYFRLVPGARLAYEGETDEGTERTAIEVLETTKVVHGVVATVVLDRVYLDDELIEETYDWYAQDAVGNVWYLGEESKEIDEGVVVSTAGSWEWGLDGALPGVVMWADPAAHLGEEYRQEYYKGEAEDWGKVVALDQTVQVPYGSLTGCIKTEDWNALAEGREYKYYCPQIGLVLETVAPAEEERVQLVEVEMP
jgi:hypothetical protein